MTSRCTEARHRQRQRQPESRRSPTRLGLCSDSNRNLIANVATTGGQILTGVRIWPDRARILAELEVRSESGLIVVMIVALTTVIRPDYSQNLTQS